jgi:hypothetical protein
MKPKNRIIYIFAFLLKLFFASSYLFLLKTYGFTNCLRLASFTAPFTALLIFGCTTHRDGCNAEETFFKKKPLSVKNRFEEKRHSRLSL